MAENTRKPKKISLDDVLREDGGAGPTGDEDGIIEVVAGDEPGAEEELEITPAAAGPPPAEDQDPGAAQFEEMLAEALQEKEKIHELYLRTRADYENFRKRVERDGAEARIRAAAGVVGDLLPIIDNLDRALAQPEGAPGFREGIALIRRQIDETLRRMGLEPIEALGETFNPICHEALAVEPREGFAPNTIIEEVRRGYTLGGRVLRASLVKVVAAPPTSADQRGGEGEADGSDHRD